MVIDARHLFAERVMQTYNMVIDDDDRVNELLSWFAKSRYGFRIVIDAERTPKEI